MGRCLRYRRATFFSKLIYVFHVYGCFVCVYVYAHNMPGAKRSERCTDQLGLQSQTAARHCVGAGNWPWVLKKSKQYLDHGAISTAWAFCFCICSQSRARVCRQQPKPSAQAQPCLSLPLEAPASALSDSLPNDGWTVAGLSPHSGARHTHPTTGLGHWGL